MGAASPTEEQLGGGDHLLSPGTVAARGHECSWRPGQGWPKDQSPSSGSFSHLPSPEAWRQLEISGRGGRSQRLMCELPVLLTDAPGGRFDCPVLEPGGLWDVDCGADLQELGVELGG